MIHPWYAVRYVAFITRELWVGAFRVAVEAFTPGIATPAIVEYPLRCRTDLEVTFMTSSITITPGTLVLGIAAGTDDVPPTIFVHSMFGKGRAEVVAGLRDMEDRLLLMTRGRREAR
ncbi:MAG: Na+/H+ antiporter subunit E [Actinomycetales bacterium]|jgi:Multisubunit Na+/H+ antiporter, MnhE subunit|nr:Na+/H+ antiporter subunit E [Actinomycetales bacterium]